MERHIQRDEKENNEEFKLLLHLLDFLSHIYGENVKHGVGVFLHTAINVQNIGKKKYGRLLASLNEIGNQSTYDYVKFNNWTHVWEGIFTLQKLAHKLCIRLHLFKFN